MTFTCMSNTQLHLLSTCSHLLITQYNINNINKICTKEHPKQFISMQKTPDPNDIPLISEQRLTHSRMFSGLISWTSKLVRNDAAQSWPPPLHDWKTCVPLSECRSQSWRKKKKRRESLKLYSTGYIFCCLLIKEFHCCCLSEHKNVMASNHLRFPKLHLYTMTRGTGRLSHS